MGRALIDGQFSDERMDLGRIRRGGGTDFDIHGDFLFVGMAILPAIRGPRRRQYREFPLLRAGRGSATLLRVIARVQTRA
ncbi:hypothetical protein D3C85_1511780 [compost metagenome]